jgi:hypothetical protein
MKKKVSKKLVFNKETLVNLDMQNLKGGLTPTITSCPPKCNTFALCTVPCITDAGDCSLYQIC